MGVALIAIIVATGFVFSLFHYSLQYKLNRSDGWIPYFAVATVGCAFFAVTLPLVMWFDVMNIGRNIADFFNLTYKDIIQWGISFKELKFIAWATVAFVVSLVCGFFSWLYYRIPCVREKLSLKLGGRDPLEKIIVGNIFANKNHINDPDAELFCVCVTLKSGKVYVGFCYNVPLEHGKINGFPLTPLLSGYRDKENHKLYFSVNYLNHFKEYPEFQSDPREVFNQYKVIVFSEHVEYISLFDVKAYENFQEKSLASFDWEYP